MDVSAPLTSASDLTMKGGAPGAVKRPATSRPVAVGARLITRREAEALRSLERTFRELYTRVLPELEEGKHVVLGVTSAIRGEGRTTTALGLASAIAADLDVRVLLAELDLEQPSLAAILRMPATPGIVGVLAGGVPIGEAITRLAPGALDVLPAGIALGSVSRMLRSTAMGQLVAHARASYDVTILDMPPALDGSDVVPLAAQADGLVLAVRAAVTPASLIAQTTERFTPGAVRSVVLNGQRSMIPGWLRRLL